MTTINTIAWDGIRAEVLNDSEVQTEYDALEAEFNVARLIIALRKASGLNQRDFAARVGMKQPQLARIESGKQIPKLETLMKLAAGSGYILELHFVPADQSPVPKLAPLQLSSNSLVNP